MIDSIASAVVAAAAAVMLVGASFVLVAALAVGGRLVEASNKCK